VARAFGAVDFAPQVSETSRGAFASWIQSLD
jgi:hypothetical protein